MKKRSLQLCPKKKFPFEILSFIKKKPLKYEYKVENIYRINKTNCQGYQTKKNDKTIEVHKMLVS